MAAQVHITGAAGSGASTLGRSLAERIGATYLDSDDFFWAPTERPFTRKRPVEERLSLLVAAQIGAPNGWVLAGAVEGWGEIALEGLDLTIFLRTPTPIRLARIRRRESEKFGDRIRPGGDMQVNHAEFLKWAASYDEPYFRGRSLQRQLDWLSDRPEPVLELSGARPVEELLPLCLARLGLAA